MKVIVHISVAVFVGFFNTSANCQESSQEKLETAVRYLMNNKEQLALVWMSHVKNNSAKVFDYKKIIGNKMEFEVTDTLSPRGLFPFIDSLKKDENLIDLTDSEIDSLIVLDKKNHFKAYSDSAFNAYLFKNKLKEKKDFKIVFSEPVGNTLRAELWYTYFGREHYTLFGDAIMILFFFSDEQQIKKVYFIRAIK